MNADEVNERLQGGIETCRSVIANYRLLLMDKQLAPTASEADGSAVNAPGAQPATPKSQVPTPEALDPKHT